MHKEFDAWNEIKKLVHAREFTHFVHEREVWWCALGVNVGYEQDGKNDGFERPVLVVRKFSRNTVLIVPLTSKVRFRPHAIRFEHQGREYMALTSQLRLISTKRLLRKIYKMDSLMFAALRERIIEIL